MAKYRRLSRIISMQTLVGLLLRGDHSLKMVEDSFRYLKKEFAPELREKDDFSESLVKGTLEKRAAIDTLIYRFAPEWPIERLSPVERTILEIGSYELMNFEETPLAVIVNEWVDIAKEFGDETAGKFVNGVLSNIGHHLRPDQQRPPSLLRTKKKEV